MPSPAIESLHHPDQLAQVAVTHEEQLAPGVSAMGGKSFLAKKMAASGCVATRTPSLPSYPC
jgi:hypothetical protein